ncbi:GSCFA domain-containing protein [Flavobacterium sp. MFBS3-15]|uniref:GSCFA domain-containing protein n=1 Tax=Flavobacterium sp. MFBS3-15 TaxID=2989816 RepID=UPI002236B7C6|nr:GSCFA domain-containing protein [Flavobacterium sp. MFBS3-15]MCW4469523.1 GSCFA domain-containing protein [Flavobacterium sp. MFBS3-15]
MQFTTQIPVQKSSNPIEYNSRVVSLGSCFAVNIRQKLDYFKFRNTTNPFGILFHPLALEKFIAFAVNGKTFTEGDIFFHNERWHCFDAHSDLSHPDKDVLLQNLNSAAALANAEIKAASHLIITLGTAWVYRSNASGELVANCHKVPQKEFTKELLSVDSIRQSLQNIITLVKDTNPEAHIIFTISPVRHIKDGFVQNQWSKANLITALHQILATGNQQPATGYFPSYEIMMDELRDYRFYAEDMIHPNQVAINYIWERFTDAFMTHEALATMKMADSIQKGLQHRSFNPESQQHRDFLSNLNDKIAALQQQHSHIRF